jgi:hypothetical protein
MTEKVSSIPIKEIRPVARVSWLVRLVLSYISITLFLNILLYYIYGEQFLTELLQVLSVISFFFFFASVIFYATKEETSINHTLVITALWHLPVEQMSMQETIDRISTELLAEKYATKKQLSQLEDIIIEVHMGKMYRPIMCKLFNSRIISKNQWFFVCDRNRYYDLAKQMLSVGIKPKYVYFSPRNNKKEEKSNTLYTDEFAIVLGCEEDYNLAKLTFESSNINQENGTVIGYSSDALFEYIDKIKNKGEEFVADPSRHGPAKSKKSKNTP